MDNIYIIKYDVCYKNIFLSGKFFLFFKVNIFQETEKYKKLNNKNNNNFPKTAFAILAHGQKLN